MYEIEKNKEALSTSDKYDLSQQRRRKFLEKLEVPIVQGGMGIGISMGNLAGHVAKEGGMGTISTAVIGFLEEDFYENNHEANMRALEREIKKAQEISGGKGLVAINAMCVTTNFKESIQKAVESNIDAVVCGAGLPLDLPSIVDNEDVLLAPIVSSGKAAALIIKRWHRNYDRKPDFIVVEGPLAGGHLGFKRDELGGENEPKLKDIVKEVVEVAEGIPVIAAGGIFNAKDIREAISWGAYGVQLGTRFIGTIECDASEGFKEKILKTKKEDIRLTNSPVGLPGRGIETSLLKSIDLGERKPPRRCIDCIKTCDPKDTVYCISEALRAAYFGDEEGLFFSGAKGYKVEEITTVSKIFDELKEGFK